MPYAHREDGYQLGAWAGYQRASWARGQVSEQRVRRRRAGWSLPRIADALNRERVPSHPPQVRSEAVGESRDRGAAARAVLGDEGR